VVPTGFRSATTISHGPWPGPRTEAGKGAATATPNPSRIGKTSQTLIGKYLLYLDQNTFFGSTRIVTIP
jgi:ABC-type Fe2+-enterobactin transport system substrate-binding protein